MNEAVNQTEEPVEEQTEAPKPQFTKKQIDRITQPAMAMLLTMIVTVAIVLPIMLLNPMSKNNDYDPDIDVAQLAAEGSSATPIRLAAPDVPDDWYASFARWKHDNAANISMWEVGYVTGDKEFMGVTQAIDVNPSWLSEYTQKSTDQGTVMSAGYPWETRQAEDNTYWILDSENTDLPDSSDGKTQTVILTGSGTEDQLNELAEATIAELKKTN